MICMGGHSWKQKPPKWAFCLMASLHSDCQIVGDHEMGGYMEVLDGSW